MVLLSTTTFALSEHFCGDELVDFSLFSTAESCGSDMEMSTPIEGCTIQKDNCCKDLVIKVDGQNEVLTMATNLNLDQQVFLATFVYSYINLFEGFQNKISLFSDYPPPIIVKSIYKLDETYLI
jgi:hypothetical protein